MASKHNLSFIDSELRRIRKEHLYRKLRYGRTAGSHITIDGKRLLNLCSNDYLGINTGNMGFRQMQSSSRLVSGNDPSYKKLEEALAKHKSQQNCLVYPTGYMANLGAISSVAGKGDLILSDELNHASIIESCKLTDAKVLVYKHNDMQDLQKKLRNTGKNKFIITEGIFSMDGDFSSLKQITEISERAGAITVVDDAHGDFVAGSDGRGTPDYFGVAKKIDVYISSLSKGLGSFGGYVTSQNNVIDLCINKSKSFIYTSALPSFLIDYSLKRFNSKREVQRKKLEKNTRQISDGLKQIGFETGSQTHIIPIIVGSEKTAINFGRFLFENQIFAQPIRYPTVPRNQARLRISVTAWLSDKEIDRSLGIFEKAYAKFG